MSGSIRMFSARRIGLRRTTRGQSITEFVIIIPILLLLILGTLQFALIYMAKATLNQAAMTGARQGAVSNASLCAIRRGVVKGLTPLYQGTGNNASVLGYTEARTRAWIATMEGTFGGPGNVSIDLLNPSSKSFSDFQQSVAGKQEIPNSRLLYRNTTVGSSSGQTIQDANLLKIRVHYCYKLIVPTVSTLLKSLHGSGLSFDSLCYANGGTPLQSDATVLMQSPARKSSTLESIGVCSPL